MHYGWFLLGGSIVLVGLITVAQAVEQNIVENVEFQSNIEDGFVAEDSHEQSAPAHEFHPPRPTPPCCAPPTLMNSHYLIASTMDGKIKALDVRQNGAVVWESNFDSSPLMDGNLGNVQPIQHPDGGQFHLVPALDGSLYMYGRFENILEPIPLTTDDLINESRKIGREAVAGGKTVSTTGVDPITGKIRYHCSSAKCETNTDDGITEATLIFKKSSHSVRAVDAFSGTERWNLSVAEYDATLVVKSYNTEQTTGVVDNINYLVSPAEGVVDAYDNCGNHIWSQQSGNHIAHLWELRGGDLKEISLFKSENIQTSPSRHSPDDDTERNDPSPTLNGLESLFYLGTNNNQPFIIHSPRMKTEIVRIARDAYSDGRRGSRPFAVSKSSYRLQPSTIMDMLTYTYTQSYTGSLNQQGQQKIAAPQTNDLQIVPREKRHLRPPSTSCPYSASSAVGDTEIILAGQTDLDIGFLVYASTSQDQLSSTSQKAYKCLFGRESLCFDKWAARWWAITFFTMFTLSFLTKRFANSLNGPQQGSSGRIQEIAGERATVMEIHDEDKSKESKDTSDERTSDKESPVTQVTYLTNSSTPPSPSENAASRTRRITLSASLSVNEPFSSRFLTEFLAVRVLGKGGFGVVFEARNKLDATPYAIKRIAVQNNEHSKQRVRREVRAMAQLDHPGIIRYYHSWIEEPPAGWQEEADAALLVKIKARKLEMKERGALDSDLVHSDTTAGSGFFPVAVGASGDDIFDNKENSEYDRSDIILQKTLNMPLLKKDDSEGSWLDDSEKEDNSNTDSDDEDSSSSEEECIVRKTPLRDHQEEQSESIVFEEHSSTSRRSRQISLKSNSSKEVSQIDTNMVLVTSQNEEDLLPSNDIKNHVYFYIQMQLCQSRTLSDWLKKHTATADRPLAKMQSWLSQLVSAAAYIHDRRLIHRDIKPQNIFFSTDNQLKIGDMGLVSKNVPFEEQLDPLHNEGGVLHTGDVGTRSYMSPEQLAHRSYTSKVDVFALGMIYTEMVVPFATAMERIQTLGQLQRGEDVTVLNECPSEKKFISWLCNMDPADRPTCHEILDSDYWMPIVTDPPPLHRSSRRYSTSDRSSSHPLE